MKMGILALSLGVMASSCTVKMEPLKSEQIRTFAADKLQRVTDNQ